MKSTPLRPATAPSHVDCTSLPSGVTPPTPVMATRRSVLTRWTGSLALSRRHGSRPAPQSSRYQGVRQHPRIAVEPLHGPLPPSTPPSRRNGRRGNASTVPPAEPEAYHRKIRGMPHRVLESESARCVSERAGTSAAPRGQRHRPGRDPAPTKASGPPDGGPRRLQLEHRGGRRRAGWDPAPTDASGPPDGGPEGKARASPRARRAGWDPAPTDASGPPDGGPEGIARASPRAPAGRMGSGPYRCFGAT